MEEKLTCYLLDGKKFYNIKQAYLYSRAYISPMPTDYQYFYRKFTKWMKQMEVQPIRIDGRTAFSEKSVKAFCDYWNLFF